MDSHGRMDQRTARAWTSMVEERLTGQAWREAGLERPTLGGAVTALRRHWPEYLIEAGGLGLFMVSAGLFATLLWYPASPLAAGGARRRLRRALMGLLMGLTAIADHLLALGPPVGRAHQPRGHADLLAARQGQDLGCGLLRAGAVHRRRARRAAGAGAARRRLRRPAGQLRRDRAGAGRRPGRAARRGGDLLRLMLVILLTTNTPRLMRLTGVFAGCLVALYITLEAPLSGMSMNPARTLASALPGSLWQGLWLYFVGPLRRHAARGRDLPAAARHGRGGSAPSSTITRSAAASSAATTWPRAATATEREPPMSTQPHGAQAAQRAVAPL